MPISFDRRNQRWRFNFNRVIAGKRHRASRLLPKTWTRAEAQKYDQAECARLYAIATGVQRQQWLIDDAVLYYLEERAPTLKSFANIQRELAAFADIYAGADLPTVAAVLGHESMVSTKRYSHLMTERLTAALGLVGKRVRTPGEKKAA